MNDPIVTIECPFGTEHDVPGDDVRVLRSGESHFLIACDCSPVPLAAAHLPHEHVWRFLDVDENSHLGFVDGTAPSPSQWLALEELADGWYDDDPWRWVSEYNKTPQLLRDEMREQICELADDNETNASGGADAVDEAAREVPCPSCNADAGQKCERPSGHSVRKAHTDRKDAARNEGVIESAAPDSGESQGEQTSIGRWSE